MQTMRTKISWMLLSVLLHVALFLSAGAYYQRPLVEKSKPKRLSIANIKLVKASPVKRAYRHKIKSQRPPVEQINKINLVNKAVVGRGSFDSVPEPDCYKLWVRNEQERRLPKP